MKKLIFLLTLIACDPPQPIGIDTSGKYPIIYIVKQKISPDTLISTKLMFCNVSNPAAFAAIAVGDSLTNRDCKWRSNSAR